MAGPGNQHCAICIGTLSFPATNRHRSLAMNNSGDRWKRHVKAEKSQRIATFLILRFINILIAYTYLLANT